MKASSHSRRIAALPRRPLAVALAGVCAVSAHLAGAAVLPAGFEAPPYAAHTASVPPPPPLRSPNVLPVTNCNDDGEGSLRVAAESAADGDTVDLTQLVCSRISLTTGTIFIGSRDVTIVGPGRDRLAIDASQTPAGTFGRVFDHLGGGWLGIEGVSVTGGRKYAADQTVTGGCVYSNENVMVRNAAIHDCNAISGGGDSVLGGGVFAQGFVSLDHAIIRNNVTLAYGSGYSSGGGVYALGGIRAAYSLIADNMAASLGATPTFGGGIFARGYSAILESAVVRNYAHRAGGLALAAVDDNLSFVFQSTISGNSADVIGGMYSREALYLYNSTIARNTARHTTLNGNVMGVGLQWGGLDDLHMVSTILADNTSEEASAFDLGGETVLPGGIVFDGSHNIIASTNQAPPPDTIWGPAALGPLTDNGGPTPTHAVGAGSAAVDSGAMPNLGAFTFDQRGARFPRLAGAAVDVGAFESDPDRIFTNGFDF